MYYNYPSNGTKKVCTVTAVDLKRSVCKCISDLGETITDVRWLVPTGGSNGHMSSTHPVERSKVLVDTSSGFPFILGAIPEESAYVVRRSNISMQDIDTVSLANYSTVYTGDLVRGPGVPRDLKVGDMVNTTDGGGIQGILSSGTVINKASSLAQMIMSRFGDLVRIVSRNFEHFTDVDKTSKVSIRGNLYTKQELYRDPIKSRNEIPNVVRIGGNVSAAESIYNVEHEGYTDEDGFDHQYTYASIPLDKFPEITPDEIVEKEYVYNDEDQDVFPKVPVSTYTRDIQGAEFNRIQNVPGSIYSSYLNNKDFSSKSFVNEESNSEKVQNATSHSKVVEGGIKTNWRMNETEFHWGVDSDEIYIHGDASGVSINVKGVTTIVASSDGNLTVTNEGDTSISTLGSLSIAAEDTTFDLNNVTFNTGGSTTFNSSGNFKVTAPIIELN